MRRLRIRWIFLSFLVCMQAHAIPLDKLTERALTADFDPKTQGEYVEYKAAQQEFIQGNYDLATTRYLKALELNPIFFPSLIGLAEIADKQGNPSQAQAYFDQAFRAVDSSAMLYTAYGKFLFKSARIEEAVEAFETALQINPAAANAAVELAVIALSREGNPQKAVKYYQPAVADDPENTAYRYGLSSAQAAAGDVDGAIATLQHVSREQPDNALPWQFMGLYYARAARFDESISALQASEKLDPDNANTRWLLAESYKASGQHQQALRVYQSFIDSNQQADIAHWKRGVVFHLDKDFKSAREEYMAAIEINPELPDPYNNLAYMTLETEEDYEQGLQWAKRAVELDPDNPAILDTLGWLYFQVGEYQQAKDTLHKAVLGVPASAEANLHLSKVYEHLNDEDAARKYRAAAKSIEESS